MRDWIQSYTGKMVQPLALKPEQVCIKDIAHALSNKCRYTGHSREFYSVAQHALVGSRHIDPKHALTFLLHEVSEAYLPDIASPVKPSMFVERRVQQGGNNIVVTKAPWKELEKEHAEVIGRALGLPQLATDIDAFPEVKQMDLAMLAWEVRDLMNDPPGEWWPAGSIPPPPSDKRLFGLPPREAEYLFLVRYYELTGTR